MDLEKICADLDKAYPLDDDRDKTLPYWTAADLRAVARGRPNAWAVLLAGELERAGVRTVGELIDVRAQGPATERK
jgi:hypothetical protein